MDKLSNAQLKQIDDANIILAAELPTAWLYSSKSWLWTEGLRGGLVNMDLYLLAKQYYGNLWNYTGD